MKQHRIHARILLLFASLGALQGQAAEQVATNGAIRINDVPPAVRQVFLDKSKGGIIRQIFKSPATYVARIDSQGQKSEIRVTEEGKTLRIRSKQEAEALFEQEQRLAKAGKLNLVPLAEVPARARNVITEKSVGATVEQIVKAPAMFTARIEQDGEQSEIRVEEGGKLLSAAPQATMPRQAEKSADHAAP